MKIKTTPIILLIVFASTAQAKVDVAINSINLKLGYDVEVYKIFYNGGVEFDITINKNYHLQPSIFYNENNGIGLNSNFIYEYNIDNMFHVQSGIEFITKNAIGYIDNLKPSDDLQLYYLKIPLSLLISSLSGSTRVSLAPYFKFLLFYSYNNLIDDSWIDDVDNFDCGIYFDLGFYFKMIYIGAFMDLGFMEPNYSIKRKAYNGYYYETGYFKNMELGFSIGVKF